MTVEGWFLLQDLAQKPRYIKFYHKYLPKSLLKRYIVIIIHIRGHKDYKFIETTRHRKALTNYLRHEGRASLYG